MFGLGDLAEVEPLWNIAPSELIATIRTPRRARADDVRDHPGFLD